MASQQDFNIIQTIFTRLASVAGRVARFSYTQAAYDARQVEGVAVYDYQREQNIPLATATTTNEIVLNKGVRAQGASIGREFQNHFIGRLSFNVNMIVDMFLSFITGFNSFVRHNANEYDPTATYFPGDIAYTTTFVGDQVVYTWHRRRNSIDPAGTIGIPPSDAVRWELVRETTSLAQELAPGTNLRNVRRTGLYSASTINVFSTIMDTPAGATPQPFTLRVYSDPANNTMTAQEILYKNVGIEYTRVLENNLVIVNWYISKNPIGLSITGVKGLWAFRVDARGHLMLHYGPTDAMPNMRIDRDPQSPTFGRLFWRFHL